MQIRIGDLVQIKIPTDRSDPQDIWLVIGFSNWSDFIRVQNVRNGYKSQYNISFLKHYKTDKKLTVFNLTNK